MGRYLKNVKLQTGASHAIQVPVSPASVGPDVPEDGMLRFNSTVNQLEWFYNGQWWDVANRGAVDVIVETHTGDEFDGAFSIVLTNQAASVSDITVFIGGVYQIPNIHYTFVTPSTLTLVSAPPTVDYAGNSNYVTIVFNLNSTNAVYG